jgi:S-adenosyl-L-methionine hydrolase (adenosine-forming)
LARLGWAGETSGHFEHPAKYSPLAQYMWASVPHSLRLITLLTDFGDRDWFVAAMKGTILSIHPDTRIVDLSHQIAPYRIDEAGYFLKSCYREFPAGAIHVVVVDPGVGSARRAIVVKSARYFFLAPDNGVLTSIFDDEQPVEVREIDQREFRRKSPGHTFDGRDLFAPAAARLARHEPFESYGPVIGDYRTLPLSQPHWEQTTLVGEIVYVDRFGNLISNITPAHLEEARSLTKRRQLLIRIGERIIEERVNSYSEGMVEKPSLLINSDGRLEIFLKEASAADLLQVGRGARIEVL